MSTVQPIAPSPQATTSSPQPANATVEGRVTGGAEALKANSQSPAPARTAPQTQPSAQPTAQGLTSQAQQAPASQATASSQQPVPQAPAGSPTEQRETSPASQSQKPTVQGSGAATSGPTQTQTVQNQNSSAHQLLAQSQPGTQDVTVERVRTDGAVTVRTSAGEATIQINPKQIPAFLRPGAVVTLILQQNEKGLQAILQSRTAAQGSAATSTTQQASSSAQSGASSAAISTAETSTSTAAQTAKTLPPLSDGQVARAIVLRPTSLPQSIAGGPIPAAVAAPQQAAKAAARYLLASSPHLRPSSTLPPAPQASAQPTSAPAQTGAASQVVANKLDVAQQNGPTIAESSTLKSPAMNLATPASQGPTPSPAGGAGTAVPASPATAAGASSLQDKNVPAGASGQSTTVAAQSGSTAAPSPGLASAPSKPAATLPPGTDFPVKVLSVGSTTSNALTAQHLGSGSVISGTIVATGGSGQAIVNSSIGLLDVSARAEAGQMQSSIRMEILGRSESDARGQIGSGSPTPLSVLAREWPALEESLRALEVSAPQSAAQIASTIARPGPQLTASMLFFLAAIRGGAIGNWLGKDAGHALEKSHGRLLSTLSGDFQSLSRASDGGPETGGWRAFFMPIQNQDALEQIRLFILPPPFERNDEENPTNDDNTGENRGDGETRFVVDLMLTGLGAFQIDGSVAKQSMSLLIRTTRALPSVMRADIIDIFETAAGRTGMAGAVRFKVQEEFPPLPIADLMPDGRQNPDVFA